MATYLCTDDARRRAVRAQTALNAIDAVEVLDDDAPLPALRQRVLRVSFVNDPAPAGVSADNVVVAGGERVVHIAVTDVTYDGNVLVVTVDQPGDFSEYTLRLVQPGGGAPLAGMDPVMAEIAFSFKVECPTDFDCAGTSVCAPSDAAAPDIDYLAKDYQSFTARMLDRITLLSPRWTERVPADLGVTLVELLAYVADRLSYRQDAVATEAYLGTARQRISVRRHARLVDYAISEGCNARAWVCFDVSGDVVVAPRTELLTSVPAAGPTLAPGSFALDEARQQRPESFETANTQPVTLRLEHNEMSFHSWGGVDCCLPPRATKATLRGAFPKLAAGDVLVFEETRGRLTGEPADADPSRRHAVRLTSAHVSSDPLGAAFSGTPAPPPAPVDVTEIAWSDEDALPFALRLSETIVDPKTGTAVRVDSAVAKGNVILADHGRTVTESVVVPPDPAPIEQPRVAGAVGPARALRPFRPTLREAPLTFAAPIDPKASARATETWSASTALPVVALETVPASRAWRAQPDLIESDESATDFVAEIDNAGAAHLRFGDDDYGKRPDPDTTFTATYRVGNGTTGNVGALAIRHAVSSDTGILGVSNRLPAKGGVDPETLEHVRQIAPHAFRTQERAVTVDDYADRLSTRPEVLRATATFRWTGSWYTVFDTVERKDQAPIDADYAAILEDFLETYRVVGKDVDIDVPRFVSLDVAADVCVKRDYFRADVLAALRAVFSASPGGLFDPARFAFGQTVYLSPLYAAAMAVEGVDSIEFTQFEPRGAPSRSGLAAGAIPMGRLEIARVAGDPSFPERGHVTFTMRGGK